MRMLRNLLLGLLLLTIIAALLLYFNLNRITQHTIETGASRALGLPTTVGSAHLRITGGHLTVKNLCIANPGGFAWPNLLTIGKADAVVEYSQLTQQPIHIRSLTLDRPILSIEQSGRKFNFQSLERRDPHATVAVLMPIAYSLEDAADQPRFVIDTLIVRNATVVLRPASDGTVEQERLIAVPSFTLHQVGVVWNGGIEARQLAGRVIAAIVERTAMHPRVPEKMRAALTAAGKGMDHMRATLVSE